MVSGTQALPVWTDILAPNSETGDACGEVRIVPDLSSFRVLPFAPSRAACNSYLLKLSDDGSVEPWEHCPRHFLKRQIAELEKLGFSIKCSFEYEFSLFKKDSKNELVGLPGTFINVHVENKYIPFVDDLTDALVAQGITPELTHKEAGLGQLEYVLYYDDPMKTADNHLIMRETLHAIADKHGYVVSLLPKIDEGIGAGCHIHMSLWKDGKNVTTHNGRFTPEAEHFVAGILHNVSALMALTNPSTNSYRRIKPGYWVGAYNVWGIFNKEAVIRVSGDSKGGVGNHWEYKTVDATTNPFLAIGGLIACGIDGIVNKIQLPPPTNVDPDSLSEEERQKRNIHRLPHTLPETLQHLKQNKTLTTALGKLASSFIAVKTLEAEHFKDKSLKDEVKEIFSAY